jgi:hypothetical protein
VTTLHAGPDGLFAVEPDLVWSSFDGVSWMADDTYDGPQGWFGQLVRCGNQLVYLNEDLELYALEWPPASE